MTDEDRKFLHDNPNTQDVVDWVEGYALKTDKLAQLLAGCKCGVYVTVNAHRDSYETAQQVLQDRIRYPRLQEVSQGLQQKMIELNTIVEIQFYPRTPVTFYLVYHYDLNAALDEALKCLKN